MLDRDLHPEGMMFHPTEHLFLCDSEKRDWLSFSLFKLLKHFFLVSYLFVFYSSNIIALTSFLNALHTLEL